MLWRRVSGFSVGTTSAASCGLIAMTMTLGVVDRAGLIRTPRAASAAISSAGCGSSTAIFVRIEPEREPALQHRAAHLAGADQHERAGEVLSDAAMTAPVIPGAPASVDQPGIA